MHLKLRNKRFVFVKFCNFFNRHVREFVSWLVSEEMVIYYINSFKQSMWPKGKLAPYPPPRTNLVSFEYLLISEVKLPVGSFSSQLFFNSFPNISFTGQKLFIKGILNRNLYFFCIVLLLIPSSQDRKWFKKWVLKLFDTPSLCFKKKKKWSPIISIWPFHGWFEKWPVFCMKNHLDSSNAYQRRILDPVEHLRWSFRWN